MLYGISEEDPVEMVMRIRLEAGLPPYSQDWDSLDNPGLSWDSPNDPSLSWDSPNDPSLPWDNGHTSGSWDDGHNQVFGGRGLAPARFRGQDFRPPMFPPCPRFESGPRSLRPPGPNHPSFRGSRPEERPGYPSIGQDYGQQGEVGFNKGYDAVRPNRPGFGRGGDTGPQPKGRGNPSPMQGISRGQLHPRASFGHLQTAEKTNLTPPAAVPEKASRFVRPVQDGFVRGSNAANQTFNQSNIGGVVQPRPAHRVGVVQTRSAHSSWSDQVPFSPANTTPAWSVAPRTTSHANNFSYVPVTVSAGSTLPTCTAWNPVSSLSLYAQPQPNSTLPLYGQPQPSTTLTTQIYQTNAAVTTTGVSVSEQYGIWPDAAQSDYLAYYNSYLQTMGVSDATSFLNMAVVPSAAASIPEPPSTSTSVQTTDLGYASHAMAYANTAAAAYYSPFYAAGGYADPTQAQLQNYLLYSYGSNKPA